MEMLSFEIIAKQAEMSQTAKIPRMPIDISVEDPSKTKLVRPEATSGSDSASMYRVPDNTVTIKDI